MRKYSKSTGCCYIPGLHSVIPADAVDIPDELYDEVIGNPPIGKVRDHDENGLPFLIDYVPPEQTAEEKAAAERAWRDGELSSTEWMVMRHRDEADMTTATSLTAEQFAGLLTYRQELRDWPSSKSFPGINDRPVTPAWLEAVHA